jgi:hypothetical protein
MDLTLPLQVYSVEAGLMPNSKHYAVIELASEFWIFENGL